MIQVLSDKDTNSKYLLINRSYSSVYTDNPEYQFKYIRHLEENYIKPIQNSQLPPKKILVIGAGGFSFGKDDVHNSYTYIDIDSSILEIAEEHLMKRKLSDNKKFLGIPARAFMRQNQEYYDLILLDAYSHRNNIPSQFCLLYTSPSPRDRTRSRMPSSA